MLYITIYKDDIYAGHGTVDAYGSITCGAVLGEDQTTAEAAYYAIERAIRNGACTISSGSHEYSWDIVLSYSAQIKIEELREEAAAAGDAAMVDICGRALDGEIEAMLQCCRAINDTRA